MNNMHPVGCWLGLVFLGLSLFVYWNSPATKNTNHKENMVFVMACYMVLPYSLNIYSLPEQMSRERVIMLVGVRNTLEIQHIEFEMEFEVILLVLI